MTKQNLNQKLDLHDHEREQYAIQWLSNSRLQIIPSEDGFGNKTINIKAFGRQWEFSQSQIIDTSILGLGGLIDNKSIQVSFLYLIWMILNDTATEVKGFGATQRPQTTLSSIGAGGNKGTQLTCDISGLTYQFTIGSKVLVYKDSTNYNTGTLISITDANTMVIQLDNDTWGANLSSTGHTITQHNLFRPYDLVESTTDSISTLYATNYKLLGYGFYTDGSGYIAKIIDLTKDIGLRGDNTGIDILSSASVLNTKEPAIYFSRVDNRWKASQDGATAETIITTLDNNDYKNPAGMIAMYGGAAAPAGWKLCDGSAISRATYSVLYGIIGTTFGTGDGSTTFNLPDFRGIFPKGAGTTNRVAGVDASGNAYASVLGTYYQDKMQGHYHELDTAGSSSPGTTGAFASNTYSNPVNVGLNNIKGSITDGTNGTPRTGHTTEPQSLGINFIIKY